MKAKAVVLCCVAAIVILLLNSEVNFAASESSAVASAKIGTLSVRKIFEQCKKNVQYKEQMTAEQQKVLAELDKLRLEIDVEKAGLRTLKSGSTEHMAQMKSVLTKQANYSAEQEYQKQQMAVKEQQWIELIYRDIVRITSEVAQQKGLALVFESSEPELSDTTAESLVMSIRTHKLLYSAGCIDITDEVMSRLDAGS